MPPADAAAPIDRATLAEMIAAAVRAALVEAVAVPQLLSGTEARKYLGISKSSWHRARSAGKLPRPVYLEGSGDRFRRADLDRFLDGLQSRRK